MSAWYENEWEQEKKVWLMMEDNFNAIWRLDLGQQTKKIKLELDVGKSSEGAGKRTEVK